jgi:hypothetical protein
VAAEHKELWSEEHTRIKIRKVKDLSQDIMVLGMSTGEQREGILEIK